VKLQPGGDDRGDGRQPKLDAILGGGPHGAEAPEGLGESPDHALVQERAAVLDREAGDTLPAPSRHADPARGLVVADGVVDQVVDQGRQAGGGCRAVAPSWGCELRPGDVPDGAAGMAHEQVGDPQQRGARDHEQAAVQQREPQAHRPPRQTRLAEELGKSTHSLAPGRRIADPR
jgi:hypothetical protein